MESQAAMMMVSMVGKGAESTVRVAGKSMKELVKLAAFLASLWKKSNAKGQVKMLRLLKDGGELSAIAMNAQNFAAFERAAEDERVMYHAVHREDNDTYLVTLRSEDLSRLKTAMQFWQVENMEDMMDMPDTPAQREEETGMRIADFDRMVEENKDNSEEMRMVYEKHWPNLKGRERLRVSAVSEETYEAFKDTAKQEHAAFAPVVREGKILLAYEAKHAQLVNEAAGGDVAYWELLRDGADSKNRASRSWENGKQDVLGADNREMDEMERAGARTWEKVMAWYQQQEAELTMNTEGSPHLRLQVEPEVMEAFEKEETAAKLGQAKALDRLQQTKATAGMTPKVKTLEITR